MFSTKGMYAPAQWLTGRSHEGKGSLLGDVSERQNIFAQYLEQVIALMHKAGYAQSGGKGGTSRASSFEDYMLGETVQPSNLRLLAA